MGYWIVSSRHSRDESTRDWESKWTTNSFLNTKRFYPFRGEHKFQKGDCCILKVFKAQKLVADFKVASSAKQDDQGHTWYAIDEVHEWNFPVHQHNLPKKYSDRLRRNPSVDVSEQDFFELIGIRNFTQNLRLNYKDRLLIRVSEKYVENLIDSKNALRSRGLEIVDRQCSFTPGNIIDLLCQDSRGDLVVVELKKNKANQTVGQLARYITDVIPLRCIDGIMRTCQRYSTRR